MYLMSREIGLKTISVLDYLEIAFESFHPNYKALILYIDLLSCLYSWQSVRNLVL